MPLRNGYRFSNERGSAPRCLCIKEVAVMLAVCPATIRQAIQAGRIKAARIGRIYRIREDDVQALWEGLKSEKELSSAAAAE